MLVFDVTIRFSHVFNMNTRLAATTTRRYIDSLCFSVCGTPSILTCTTSFQSLYTAVNIVAAGPRAASFWRPCNSHPPISPLKSYRILRQLRSGHIFVFLDASSTTPGHLTGQSRFVSDAEVPVVFRTDGVQARHRQHGVTQSLYGFINYTKL